MNALNIKNVSKSYGNVNALRNISLDVEEGEIFGFLGPNGAGKTTTIKCILDLIRQDRGEIRIFDTPNKFPYSRKDIGFLPSEGGLYENWNGLENIKFQLELGGQRVFNSDLAKKLDIDLRKKVKYLSSGNKQKLAFLIAIINNPRLLILDEPTRSLDPLVQNTVHSILLEYKKKGGTVFLSSHNLTEVEKISDRVGIIKEGQILKIEKVEGLRDMQVHLVTVKFSRPVDRDLFNIEGVEILEQFNGGFSLRVSGDINQVISRLTEVPVVGLDITHASLEEIFLEFYN